MIVVKTVVLGKPPAELEALLARRRALGQDLFDEMWKGEYHVAPASHAWHGYVDNVLAELLGPLARAAGLVGTGPFNLGGPDDYRVPDRGYHESLPSGVWVPTAALVVEVVSPDDETWEKFDFYARHGVDEICTAEPLEQRLRWFTAGGGQYEEADTSGFLGVVVVDLAAQIKWPE
ncbi:MAG: Uma2 family endonuclease [Acidimicrobiia bacterium]